MDDEQDPTLWPSDTTVKDIRETLPVAAEAFLEEMRKRDAGLSLRKHWGFPEPLSAAQLKEVPPAVVPSEPVDDEIEAMEWLAPRLGMVNGQAPLLAEKTLRRFCSHMEEEEIDQMVRIYIHGSGEEPPENWSPSMIAWQIQRELDAIAALQHGDMW